MPRVGEIEVVVPHLQAADAGGSEDWLWDGGCQAVGYHARVSACGDIETVDNAGAEIAQKDISIRKRRQTLEVRGFGHIGNLSDSTGRPCAGPVGGKWSAVRVHIDTPNGPGSGRRATAGGIVPCAHGEDVVSDLYDAGQG